MADNIVEVWKDIPGYEGIYQASSLGRIKALKRLDISGHHREERIRKLSAGKFGYLRVPIRNEKGKKLKLVHRLVALAFIPNPENKKCINHIDNNTSNNVVSNLEWCTHKENSLHRDIQGRNPDIRGSKNVMFGRTGNKCPNYGDKSYRARIVLDGNTGIFYSCVREAADSKGIKYNTLKARLHENNSYRGLLYV